MSGYDIQQPMDTLCYRQQRKKKFFFSFSVLKWHFIQEIITKFSHLFDKKKKKKKIKCAQILQSKSRFYTFTHAHLDIYCTSSKQLKIGASIWNENQKKKIK